MSQLLQLRAAIVAAIGGLVEGLDVAGHFGRFTEDELKKFMASAPAVRVAVHAIERPKPTSVDGVDYLARIGIYVATKDGAVAGGRDEQALSLVEAILLLCDRNRWGLGSFVNAAEGSSAQNLYSSAGLSGGNALWAVDLRQPVRIAPSEAATAALSAIFVGFVPDVGAAHVADYTQVAPPLESEAA